MNDCEATCAELQRQLDMMRQAYQRERDKPTELKKIQLQLLARKIAIDIYTASSDPRPVRRISFRGGIAPEAEIDLGGLKLPALTTVIEKSLAINLPASIRKK